MKIVFIKVLPWDSGFTTLSNEPFCPNINDKTFEVMVRSDELVQIYSGNILLAQCPLNSLIELIKIGYVVLRP